MAEEQGLHSGDLNPRNFYSFKVPHKFTNKFFLFSNLA